MIAPAAAITADVQIGQGSMINTGAVISHDAVIGKFCLINPRAQSRAMPLSRMKSLLGRVPSFSKGVASVRELLLARARSLPRM